MPTNRVRRLRVRHEVRPPEWALRLLETGEEPDRGSEDSNTYFGWRFLDEVVVGLPAADSDAGRKLLAKAR
jgi:hypothetical protein